MRDSGSFRDPDGFVFTIGDRVFRALRQSGLDSYRLFRDSGASQWTEQESLVVPSWEIEKPIGPELEQLPPDIVSVLEQKRVPFISYPYEWTFDMLKDAALLHLDLSIGLSRYHLTVKDSTPYNIQFVGAKPIFIDVLSFERYQNGVPWLGYTQFCQSFLYPLSLKASFGVDFQPVLRSNLDGIPTMTMKKMLGIRAWLRRGMFKHVILQSALQNSFAQSTPILTEEFKTVQFSLNHIVSLMQAMKRLISKLSPRHAASHWSSYREDNSYSPEARERKRTFVKKHLEKLAPSSVWDIGSNTGEFSLLAADHSPHVIALDADADSANNLYLYCRTHKIGGILPLVMDITDPSPALGWCLAERRSLFERGQPECILALALIHHLCLANNIPLAQIFQFVAKLGAKHAIIEFVPKTDPMVKRLLANRQDVYPWYSRSMFEKEATCLFSIGDRTEIEKDGRELYWLIRRPGT